MKTISSLLACACGLLLGFGAQRAAADPAPPGVAIKSVMVTGNGCPSGSVALDLSSDAQAFTLIFSNFLAQNGPGIPVSQIDEQCLVHVLFDVPKGFIWSIAAVDNRGFANVAPGAQAMQRVGFHMTGQPTDGPWRAFVGPYLDDWFLRDVIDISNREWAKCNGVHQLQIHTELRIDPGTSSSGDSSFVTVDSQDDSIVQTYHIDWKKCSGK
jgi:hypothetical protein